MVSLMVTLFSTKCFLFVYMFIDLFKVKAINYLKIVMQTSPDFFFKEANLFLPLSEWESPLEGACDVTTAVVISTRKNGIAITQQEKNLLLLRW